MTEPAQDKQDLPPMNVWLKLFLICLGIALTLPGLCGIVFFGGGVADWLSNGGAFSSGNYGISEASVGIGGASLIGSIFFLSILIGANRWEGGKRFCLVLAILGAATTIIFYGLLMTELSAPEEFVYLQLAAVGGLVLGFLPPFLVWRKTRMAAQNPGRP